MEDEVWKSITKEAKDLIKKLIAQPERRLTAEEALQHKWFKMLESFEKPQIMYKKNIQAFKKYMKTNKL